MRMQTTECGIVEIETNHPMVGSQVRVPGESRAGTVVGVIAGTNDFVVSWEHIRTMSFRSGFPSEAVEFVTRHVFNVLDLEEA